MVAQGAHASRTWIAEKVPPCPKGGQLLHPPFFASLVLKPNLRSRMRKGNKLTIEYAVATLVCKKT